MIEKIKLTHKDSFISFEYASLDFSSPEKIQYAYKLEGFDHDWVYSDNRRYASYTNLPPGAYTFKVKGTNSDGIWNEEGKAIKLYVIPAFWQTGWFKGSIILLILLVSVTLFKYKTYKVRKRNIELEQAVNERTDSLRKANEKLEIEVLERKKAEETVRKIAYYDYLTHLPNRRLFMELGEQELVHAKRNKTKLAILFLDLDKFKSTNDKYGHDAGDILLVEISKRIQELLRDRMIACRMGGDEFIFLIKDIKDSNEVITIVEKLIEKVTAPLIIKGNEVIVGASIGISLYPEDDGVFEQLLVKADKAMYQAKQIKEPSYQFYCEIKNDI